MKKIGKISIAWLLIVSIIISTTISCNKEIVFQNEEQNTEEVIITEKSKWLLIVVAAVELILGLAEGQYYKTTYPDGKITEGCSGIGHCAIKGRAIPPDGRSGTVPISSISDNMTMNYEAQAILALNDRGRIILAMEITNNKHDSFFYSDKITISKPLVIDNPEVLEELGITDNSIIVYGIYDVYTYSDNDINFSYIIIE